MPAVVGHCDTDDDGVAEEEEKKRKKAKRPKGTQWRPCPVDPIRMASQRSPSSSTRHSGTFYTWYDIGLFHNVRTAQIEKRDLVNYRGKIKLHGTNVAVTIQHNGNELYIQRYSLIDLRARPSPRAQRFSVPSRNTFLTKEADHHGFAKWALDKDAKEYFKSLYRRNAGYRAITVYGEWCGKGSSELLGGPWLIAASLTVVCGAGIMKGAAICKLDKRLFSVFAILYDRSKLITAPDRLEAILTASAHCSPSLCTAAATAGH